MFDIYQTIQNRDGEINDDQLSDYIDGLTLEFVNSPEWASVSEQCMEIQWVPMLIDYSATYIGSTLPHMTIDEFNKVVFSIFPRKISVEANQASLIIAELRSFWKFLDRQYCLEQAQEIVASLDSKAVQVLQEELSDPRNFGPAKSFIMAGMKAGFDMSNQDGINAFMPIYNSTLPLPQPHLFESKRSDREYEIMPPDVPEYPERIVGEALKKKRQEKKKQREAKKRNRKR